MVKDLIMPSEKGLHVETELTVGDKSEETELQVGGRQTANTITNVQEASWPMLLLLALGWLLPSPSAIWGGLLALLPWGRNK